MRAQKKEIMMWEALREAVDEEMTRDPMVCIMGELGGRTRTCGRRGRRLTRSVLREGTTRTAGGDEGDKARLPTTFAAATMWCKAHCSPGLCRCVRAGYLAPLKAVGLDPD